LVGYGSDGRALIVAMACCGSRLGTLIGAGIYFDAADTPQSWLAILSARGSA
jgi:hypothetical protein